MNFNVCAKSKYETLNKDFNSMIEALTKVKRDNVTLWDVTNFYRYYNTIKQQLF